MDNNIKLLIDEISETNVLSYEDAKLLLKSLGYDDNMSQTSLNQIEIKEIKELKEYLHDIARKKSQEIFGKTIFMRGLIEFSNYCKNDCLYCGIRKSNKNAERYRLSKEDILSCCKNGYDIGFRTFVLQSGEDPYFTKERICDIVKSIKDKYKDCALTLSIGEKDYHFYRKLKENGADRFLLRHETSDLEHYSKLHPKDMSLENRIKCLLSLKKLGFQTGTGFMLGSPFQTLENIVKDLVFMQKINPEMIGIGPFISHKDTPFARERSGEIGITLILISVLRLIFPKSLIPATTALGTIAKDGRERGILSGANVVMPNLSPMSVRKKYLLYNDKISTGQESLEGVILLRKSIESIGYTLSGERGDFEKKRKAFT